MVENWSFWITITFFVCVIAVVAGKAVRAGAAAARKKYRETQLDSQLYSARAFDPAKIR